ncbi:AAA ATPase midasin [Emydomyces testavorans]|uniref:Midasin n=1 Tax=Emydomyces testavorans TaxID=2070801 RepID=A0AAF0IHX0_9EURO|nr:AAA ATPase midasin [Emydomyces testavorans]
MDWESVHLRILSDPRILQQLPDELVEILRASTGLELLNKITRFSLNPSYTTKLFTAFEPIYVDIAARWLFLDLQSSPVEIIAAFSRILPLAQYLRPFARSVIQHQDERLPLFSRSRNVSFQDTSDETLLSLLLSVFRLLSFDRETFSLAISPAQLETLFSHSNKAVRYLSIRCFCLYMHAADAATQETLKRYCGTESISEPWEAQTIDYKFLSLWEEKRWNDLQAQLKDQRGTRDCLLFKSWIQHLPISDFAANIGGVLVPKVRPSGEMSPSMLVKTPTVLENLHSVGLALLSSEPLLVIGQAGAGKTSLITHAAREMGQLATMITLHLNEQTDLKSLLGVYSSSTRTGGFSWQPGSLTRAAKEGRWVLIEDLDRAPSEVLSVILPLIKNRELVIPSRKECIRCAEDFRIIATMRSTVNSKGIDVAPAGTMLGSRLWRQVQVKALPSVEIRQIIEEEFPLLTKARYVDTFLNLYNRMIEEFHGSSVFRGFQGRYVGLRDLIKFCCRIERRLEKLGVVTGREAIPERTDDEIFMDAVDCFAAYIPSKRFQLKVSSAIAEELRISPQRMQFCLFERIPTYSEDQDGLVLGREFCPSLKLISGQKSGRFSGKSSAFASTKASLKTMEQVAGALQMCEPVLLVGETGIGKTAVIQQLATLLNQRLTVVNLSQQSETTDLLGGYKPINLRSIAIPLIDRFHSLFDATFSVKKNQKFLSSVAKSVTTGSWSRLLNILHEAVKMASRLFQSPKAVRNGGLEVGTEQPTKRRKLDISKYGALEQRWQSFAAELKEFETHVTRGDAKVSFAFVQGKIVRALRDGEWVLLDEINLASPETLENISSLLHHGRDGKPSLLLSEAGEVEAIHGHPEFRIFAAMNPATDAGKRDLAPGLRSRFTELYVQSPDSDFDDLLGLTKTYLGPLVHRDQTAAPALASLYLDIKRLNAENKLTDGAGQKPHFSIRTLVRALLYVVDHAPIYGVRRAIYEGFCMSFLTLLGKESERLVAPYIDKHLFGKHDNSRSMLSRTPKEPVDGSGYVQFKHYWMRRGNLEPKVQSHYIITPFIERNLMNLVRASSTRRFPILLQGPTSSGKTSMVEYLAKVSGNKYVRINNHEHTDLQEYLGSYISGEDGTLRYQEGVLVEALRHGYWIVLDELNLAPTDVLEALNRLLDDNRELFLPETQEVVHPHPNFMLFATQNPAGLYGGRKILSRAFRNRFLELHFDDIPEEELEFILKERSQIAPSFCTRIVSVYRQLSILRQSSRLFEQRNSFATLRDLFRWALRRADDREQLAINGFMLLAERVRNPQERHAVKHVIEKVMGVQIDEEAVYSTRNLETRFRQLSATVPRGIVWTRAMRRLFILVSNAIEHNEPVLLVGETGCGKTQLCQAVAEAYGKELFILNAHVNLETGDLIGAQRPLRNRSSIKQSLVEDMLSVLRKTDAMPDLEEQSLDDMTDAISSLAPSELEKYKDVVSRIRSNLSRANALFEWSDGSLVSAMKCGQHFLLDELSLADDSVLERLNSVLEPHRSLLLAEKGPVDSLVVAEPGFQFLATMNPGGDYGKRELSAALRNRLTEIWVPQLSEADDILPILQAKLDSSFQNAAKPMMDFAKWFKQSYQGSVSGSLSVRDLLAWVDFLNDCKDLDPVSATIHGACLVYIDSLGANPSAMLAVASGDLEKDRRKCLEKLGELFSFDAVSVYFKETRMEINEKQMRIGPFSLAMRSDFQPDPSFALNAPTTLTNTLRVVRGLQSSKPILLEGSPGVGKTALVAALAQILGKPLTRINLSEQTDLTDLFGSDVPVEGAQVGNFAWSDAPFLRALQQGGWVLLDEMNLASQSVLEGLNSCLDHRQQVYVSELDQTFKRHPDFFLFATQNPHHQGGGRKGLPASFVNRFTVVYADSFTSDDLKLICRTISPRVPANQVARLVEFISTLNVQLLGDRRFGAIGGPWEVNLRDLSRWLMLLEKSELALHPSQFLDIIINQRFRTSEDRACASKLYAKVFGFVPDPKSYFHNLSAEVYHIGIGSLQRDRLLQRTSCGQMVIMPRDLPILESLTLCVENKWPCVLVGPSGCGKSATLQKLAAISGARLVELSLNADTDTMDLIGGFEQQDDHRQLSALINELKDILQYYIIQAYSRAESSGLGSELTELYREINDDELRLEVISDSLYNISCRHEDLRFRQLHECCVRLLTGNGHDHIRFEWTEGLLIHAIERGDWVVLDNANLCNATVLDRLNSLMEPDGYLILNEQRTDDGSIKIVKPHPQFRLFLTMDPRYGELSRAMRNRSVEIFFLQPDEECSIPSPSITFSCDSTVYRLRHCLAVGDNNTTFMDDVAFETALEHISPRDAIEINNSFSSFMQLCARHEKYPMEYLTLTVARYHSLIANNSLVGWPEGVSLSELDAESNFLNCHQNTEPIHPLVNEPRQLKYVLSPGNRRRLVNLAKLQEIQLHVAHLYQELSLVEKLARFKKPSEMNRLERSLTSKTIASHKKDSTSLLAIFLNDSCEALTNFIRDLKAPLDNSAVNSVASILEFCWDLFRLSLQRNFEDAVFLTYIKIGQSMCNNHITTSISFVETWGRMLDSFQANWRLSTGQSMQRMWEKWRPATASDPVRLQLMMELERLCSRFDEMIHTTNLPIAELSQISDSLGRAQISLLHGADGSRLVHDLTHIINELGRRLRNIDASVGPYFSTEYEALCQYRDLVEGPIIEDWVSLRGTLRLLAGRPSKCNDISLLESSVPCLLSDISRFSGFRNSFCNPFALKGTISLSLIWKLKHIGDVPLSRMNLLNSELEILAKAIARSSAQISQDQFTLLRGHIKALVKEYLICHRDLITPESLQIALGIIDNSNEPKSVLNGMKTSAIELQTSEEALLNRNFCTFATNSLSQCLADCVAEKDGLNKYLQHGKMLIRFAMALLKSFIPDRPFDPSLDVVVKREIYSQRKLAKSRKLEAIKAFEVKYSGQRTTVRIRTAEDELRLLGDEPSEPPIYRPKPSQLSDLQGELIAISNSILSKSTDEILSSCQSSMGSAGSNLIQQNIRQLCARLSNGYRAYDDITILIVRFLQLLDVGISLVQYSQTDLTDQQKLVRNISQATPFLRSPQPGSSRLQLIELSQLAQSNMDADMYLLSLISVFQNTDPETLRNTRHRAILRASLQRFYRRWKEQLEVDQAKEAEKSAFFRYRGSLEDDDTAQAQELLDIFPTFDGETDFGRVSSMKFDYNSVASKLFKIFKELFTTENAEARLRELINNAANLMGHILSESEVSMPLAQPQQHLCTVLLLLDEEKRTPPNKFYNFYTDPNLLETKKLAALIEKIRRRFSDIQRSWPEHATLADVITCCSEIHQFKHREPIAKFLTKAEKLHGYIYEWQTVASKEFSATDCYNELTGMLISWRRLELSTWARLLDIEYEKCEQDAEGWWFIAYEVIVATPLQLIDDGQDLTSHTCELISTLEKFLCSTPIGQYRFRLQLVERFKSLLQLYVLDFPSLDQLVFGLTNLINHYKPFVKILEEQLTNGRNALENDIKQEIVLTSWKDTNITALRESARRSHHKLFKVIRKYRALLGQLSNAMVTNGLPASDCLPQPDVMYSLKQSEMVPSAVLSICRKAVSNWDSRPTRFKDPTSTTQNMCHVYQTCFTDFNIPRELESFTRDVVDSINDFKSRTPHTLTEENREEVQHLKVQKHRFYAEKLRELRHMGLRSNLGTDILEKQTSTSFILATTPSFEFLEEFQQIESANSYFHRFLDLMPKARQAAREYSEDLSNVEARRSASFLEGLLSRVLSQRVTLHPALMALQTLTRVAQDMDSVSRLSKGQMRINSLMTNDRDSLQGALKWLSVILGLCITVLHIHANHADIDSSKVLDKLTSRKNELECWQVNIQQLANLPPGLSSELHDDKISQARKLITAVRADVVYLSENHPDMAFALDQVLPWTELSLSEHSVVADNHGTITPDTFDASLLSAMDKVLITIQRLKSCLSAYPSSSEDSGWLAKSENVLSKTFGELHMTEVTDSLSSALSTMRLISTTKPQRLDILAALVATALPIVHQYRYICVDLIHRYAHLHRESCKMGYILSNSFVRVASEGFCSPAEPSSEQGASGKLESGTGLGEGEGAENISKDVQDDEDLSDLAQQKEDQNGEKGDIEAANDAVDMDHNDLEADAENYEQTEGGENDEDGSDTENADDMDEEVGSIDGWDQSAVDEKLWDGKNNPEQKDTETEEGKGASNTADQVAAPENRDAEAKEKQDEGGESDDDGLEAPNDETEAIGREDIDVTEPHTKEDQILDLPEDMKLDEQDKAASSDLDDGLDEDFPDDDTATEEHEPDLEENTAYPPIEAQENEAMDDSTADPQAFQEEEPGEGARGEESEQDLKPAERAEEKAEQTNVAPSEALPAGLNNEQNDDRGESGEVTTEQESKDQTGNSQKHETNAEGGEDGHTPGNQAGGRAEDAVEDPQAQAFKKLGDILELWHQSQRKIKEGSQSENEKTQDRDVHMEEVDFEHLANDEDAADTQALGQASEDQVKSVDQNKAVESNEKPDDDDILPDAGDTENEESTEALEDLMQIDNVTGQADQKPSFPLTTFDTQNDHAFNVLNGQVEAEENIDDVDCQLSAIHLSSDLPPLTPPDEARRLWSHYESVTHDLSLSLTEQLRLILAPTMATKLRGDFRTGKRLNIKRIIPYIASQYKRDKIWMRRSVPSKRDYQIMLAVDDSKSMLESASGQLAFETLALVSKSLSMLEAGDLCIVSFGNEDHIRVAHEFGKPFSSEAGMHVFQQFSYKQTGTNVKRLVEESIALFREARAKRSSSNAGGDLWQLQLIISDGICEDHDDIRRLLRQAQEERIMIVFIIVDAVKEESASIMNLTQATFEADESGIGGGKWKMKRYLEGFPFPYYLIVRNVQELPSIFSLALKQWFAEVVEVST